MYLRLSSLSALLFVKCKFGDMVVDATYVTCTKERQRYDEKEARHKDRVSAA